MPKKNHPTIIVCIDTSNASVTALRYACHKAKNSGLAVHILVVMETSHKNLLFGARAIESEKRKILEKHLQKLIELVTQETSIVPCVSVREGDIVSEIVKEIKITEGCEMIILGKSDNSLSDNTVLPKLSKKIGSKINVPITIVPETLSDEFLQRLR